MKITEIKARQIFDSRGNPTLRVYVYCGREKFSADVPSGASTGSHEALELRDGGKKYNGKGVINAIRNIEKKIAPKLKGMELGEQREIDKKMCEMDGTSNKSKLGGNAIVGVSMAIARAGSNGCLYDYVSRLSGEKCKMPIPFSNVLNGGKHAGSGLAIQEFMVVPSGKKFSENMQIVSETYQNLKEKIKKKYGKSGTNVGDEGGFAPSIKKTSEALDLLVSAGSKYKIALDCAGSEFFSSGRYLIDGKKMDSGQMVDYYVDLIKKYPIISIEDPFNEEEFEAFAELKRKAKNVLIVGDDLLTTNLTRMHQAIVKNSVNGLLLKVNQIGTLTEAIEAHKLARSRGWKTIVSHRSGDTEDSFIADLSVGLGAYGIKTGAPARSERLVKYNRLLEIEDEVDKGKFFSQVWASFKESPK